VPYSVGFTYPGATCRALGAHCSCPTLSYKSFGQAPLPEKKRWKRLRQGKLEHNITQFSRGRWVLRSGGPNHVNLHVHHVHLELTTKRLKAFPIKEPQRAAPERLRWKCRKTTSTAHTSNLDPMTSTYKITNHVFDEIDLTNSFNFFSNLEEKRATSKKLYTNDSQDLYRKRGKNKKSRERRGLTLCTSSQQEF
jgi:hypothetical protein